MALKLKTSPALEPVTLAEIKLFLRKDSGSLADNIVTIQSILPGAHVIAENYSLVGAGIDVLGYRVLVNFNAGTCGAGGTVDAKIQESDDGITWSDWTGGTFTQVTQANDNAIQEKEYTGSKRYIRVVATVAGNTCEFGADVIKEQPYSAEDTLLSAMITAAREYCEGFQNRAYITQTWELWLDDWPVNEITIPLPPLQSITSIKYYDTANTEATFAADNYFTDIKSEPGRVVLAYGKSWPTTTLRPANGICVEFVAGYGAVASIVPQAVKWAINFRVKMAHDYLTPEETKKYQQAVESLLWLDRIVPV